MHQKSLKHSTSIGPSSLQNKTSKNPISLEIDMQHLGLTELQLFCGPLDEHLELLEKRHQITIHRRNSSFFLKGSQLAVHQAQDHILSMLKMFENHKNISPHLLRSCIVQQHLSDKAAAKPKNSCKLSTPAQQAYWSMMDQKTITFGIGPAGTGKTYLAVAKAVEAYQKGEVERIILTRPAVEAGEHLGFLPGDLAQKIDPYLRPLFDALGEFLGFEQVQIMMQKQQIEVAPLAFMRGRTLSKAFVILDEAQNTTSIQMKLFLTRLGYNSKMVITGDLLQSDLDNRQKSGLAQVIELLGSIDDIGFYFFQKSDIVRHNLISKILEAYGDI